MRMAQDWHRSDPMQNSRQKNQLSPKQALIAVVSLIAVCWLICFVFERNAFFYVMSFVASCAITLRWFWHDMPIWLRIAMFMPVAGFFLLLAYLAVR
jgi:hypothetical protein